MFDELATHLILSKQETSEMKNLQKTLQKKKEQALDLRKHRSKLDESNTIRALIIPILRELGWNDEDLDEVLSEYTLPKCRKKVDLALFIDRKPVLLIEAKKIHVNIGKVAKQILNYAELANVKWVVATNGRDWRIYNSLAPGKSTEKILTRLSLDEVDNDVDKFSLLSKESLKGDKLDQYWENEDNRIKVINDYEVIECRWPSGKVEYRGRNDFSFWAGEQVFKIVASNLTKKEAEQMKRELNKGRK